MTIINAIRNGAVALVTTVLASGGPAWAVQEDPAAAQAQQEIGAQIKELGMTLRAAAMSGALSGQEAREIYGRVVRAAKAAYVRDFGDGDGKGGEDVEPDPKTNVARLTAPRPERTQELLRAEFLRRDMQLLEGELGLDGDQSMVVEVLFDDYTEAFELASAPLREALAQYRGTNMNSYIAFALEDAGVRLDAAVDNARRADRDEAVARMQKTLARIDEEKRDDLAGASDEDRARYEAWKQSMIATTSELDDRLAAIRERTTALLADMGRDDATITAGDLLRMARQLRSDRAQLRTDLTESIAMIATAAQRGEENARFDAAMTRIRIGQLLPRGRFGGESMNLWAALTEIGRDLASRAVPGRGEDEPRAYANDLLVAWAPQIAAGLDARTEATIDREIAGIEFRVVRDRIAAANGQSIFEVDERRLAAAIRPYAVALRREVAASVTARDAVLTVLDESSAFIDQSYPESELAALYRAASLRRGFPVETRRRWAEQAAAAALELEDLDGDVREALLVVDGEIATELQALRSHAIEQRIRRDPKLARDFIESEFADAEIEFDDNMWRELEYAAFATIDERTEMQLRGVLSREQFESLPARPGRGKGKDPDKGAGRGKSGGKATGRGKSGRK